MSVVATKEGKLNGPTITIFGITVGGGSLYGILKLTHAVIVAPTFLLHLF